MSSIPPKSPPETSLKNMKDAFKRSVKTTSPDSGSSSDSDSEGGGAPLHDYDGLSASDGSSVVARSGTFTLGSSPPETKKAARAAPRAPEQSEFVIGRKPDSLVFRTPSKVGGTPLSVPKSGGASQSSTRGQHLTPSKEVVERRSVTTLGGGRHLTGSAQGSRAIADNGNFATVRIRTSDTSARVSRPESQENAEPEHDEARTGAMIPRTHDAQNIYPSSACIFVANLPENKDDVILEATITRVFAEFGTVFVKVRRDGQNMPFAFCQYTDRKDAEVAVEQGRGVPILGRPCRTEMARANRSFVIKRRDGTPITLMEVRIVLQSFGEMDKCVFLPGPDGEPSATSVLVEFKMYDAKRDLATIFRTSPEYCVHSYDPVKRAPVVTISPVRLWLDRYDADRRSVFVGGLPQDITEEQIRAHFEGLGEINEIQVLQRNNAYGFRSFAFVEYKEFSSTEEAIKVLHGTMLGGSKLRVERRNGRLPPRTPRRVQSQALGAHRPQPALSPLASRRNYNTNSGGGSGSNTTTPRSAHRTTTTVPQFSAAMGPRSENRRQPNFAPVSPTGASSPSATSGPVVVVPHGSPQPGASRIVTGAGPAGARTKRVVVNRAVSAAAAAARVAVPRVLPHQQQQQQQQFFAATPLVSAPTGSFLAPAVPTGAPAMAPMVIGPLWPYAAPATAGGAALGVFPTVQWVSTAPVSFSVPAAPAPSNLVVAQVEEKEEEEHLGGGEEGN
ncbi:hypothetical protein VTK73DRAFT_7062 [Phialemonium thermophilum]|uniref:RRM domain-containing protein n=1 Tax=Phialemonium thermophilum TaxID=223376 RepID=A0ABR3WGV7_9PEZI